MSFWKQIASVLLPKRLYFKHSADAPSKAVKKDPALNKAIASYDLENAKGFPQSLILLMTPYENLRKPQENYEVRGDWYEMGLAEKQSQNGQNNGKTENDKSALKREESLPNNCASSSKANPPVVRKVLNCSNLGQNINLTFSQRMRQRKFLSTYSSDDPRAADKADASNSENKECYYCDGKMVCETTPQGAVYRQMQDAIKAVKHRALLEALRVEEVAENSKISDQVIGNCEGEVGPGASKTSTYKNPEYYCYHPLSYLNLQLELAQFRLPQPSSKTEVPEPQEEPKRDAN